MVSFAKDPDVIFLPQFPFYFFIGFLNRFKLSSAASFSVPSSATTGPRSRPICHRFVPELKLLDEKLVLAARIGNSKVFYLKMKGKIKINISSCRFMAKLKENVLLNAFIALFLISTATAAGDSPFVITHKKASLTRLKSDFERVSLSIEIYNQGFSTAYDGSLVDHSWPQDAFDVISGNISQSWEKLDAGGVLSLSFELEAKRQGMFYDILTEIPPEKKFDWAKRLLAKYGSQTFVISIVALFVYLLVTPSKSSELVSYGCAAWCCIDGTLYKRMKKKEMKVNKKNERKHRHFRFKSNGRKHRHFRFKSNAMKHRHFRFKSNRKKHRHFRLKSNGRMYRTFVSSVNLFNKKVEKAGRMLRVTAQQIHACSCIG
ncbi:60S ribosomal protein L7A-like protein [Hibiscus syriacus]|uniref:60S ribosomal protein L7A-like protein n=1 Tax=Hibiscus syriacus TaxID=106335 RepID=A0A6A3C5H0_HIBSY|nr:60S ribosomal protein L7A-like protein [Hibiscus syriacus]